jgi:hypothetical protein
MVLINTLYRTRHSHSPSVCLQLYGWSTQDDDKQSTSGCSVRIRSGQCWKIDPKNNLFTRTGCAILVCVFARNHNNVHVNIVFGVGAITVENTRLRPGIRREWTRLWLIWISCRTMSVVVFPVFSSSNISSPHDVNAPNRTDRLFVTIR